MNRETDLFGPWAPYIGSEKGSLLNNHLANHSGKRGIVFLDEFEKTTKDVRAALLLPLDDGKSLDVFMYIRLINIGWYCDRRNGHHVDCTKIIWVFATNAVDDKIVEFSDLHLLEKSPEKQTQAPLSALEKNIRKDLCDLWGVKYFTIIPVFSIDG
jgi:ATP-dependent Clp protease ATP-binding subunit ClpA